MKILHVVPSYKPAYIYGGPIISVSRLCEAQAELGHEVVVFTTAANGEQELDVLLSQPIKVDGVTVFYFPRITGDHTHISPGLWAYLWKTFKQYEAVHVHSWWNFLVLGVVLICWFKRKKPILSVRGMMTEYSFLHRSTFKKKAIHFLIGRFLLKKTLLHATTLLEWSVCRRIIPDWKGFISPNLIQLPNIQNVKIMNNNIFTIGTLSRIDPVKGIDILIRALTYVDFPFKLKIAGKGKAEYESELRELVNQYQLNEKVEWVGWQSGDSKFQYLQGLDLLAIPSHTENFSVVAIEALAVGTPVMVSDQVGLCDTIKEHGWGWVSNLSAHAISNTLTSVFYDTVERDRIRQKVPSKVRQVYDNKIITEQYIAAYRSLL